MGNDGQIADTTTIFRRFNGAYHHSRSKVGRCRYKTVDGGHTSQHEVWSFNKVLRRVAADGKFGEDDQVCTFFRCLTNEGNHFVGVACQVANGCVDLAKSDSHSFPLYRNAT